MAMCVECVVRTFKYQNKAQTAIMGAFHHSHWIPAEIAQAPASLRITLLSRKHRRRRTERKQKRGCRAEGHEAS